MARNHMLGHLSNTPDIVWRAPYMTDLERKENYSTHFINLEKVYHGVALWHDFPSDFSEYSKESHVSSHEPEEVGTAPWRILQRHKGMVNALTSAGQAQDKKALENAVNQALLMGGLMSYFVGDLANLYHTTANYDRQLSGQRGLHAYFESDIVAELPFKLSALMPRNAKKRVAYPISKI